MNTKTLVSVAATIATVAAGVILAGYVLEMGKTYPFLMDAHKGLGGA